MRTDFKFQISNFKLAVMLLLLLFTAAAGAGADCPQLTEKYVNDYAGILAATDRKTLGEMLKDLENRHGVEMVIVTIKKTADFPDCAGDVEAFASVLFALWGPDRAGGKGIMMFVSQDDRKMQIKLGENYSAFYDAVMQKVMENKMLPFFREGHYGRGIFEGAREVVMKVSKGASLLDLYLYHIIAATAAVFVLISALLFAKPRKPRQKKERPAADAGSFGGGAAGEW